MSRAASTVVSFLVVAVSPALAERPERPMSLEFGVNTRHFAAAGPDDQVAFRTTGESDAAVPDGEALTTSLRFTGRTRWDTFLGVEAEVGALLGHAHSNLAGAYGVGGVRQEFGRVRLGAELVTGRRWVRYDLSHQRNDDSLWIAEPRVRADLWLSPVWTVGAAAGATLSDRPVWMAGLYVGVSSAAFGRWR